MAGILRRDFLVVIGGLLAAPLARARSDRTHRVIFVLIGEPRSRDIFDPFFVAMRALGYEEGKNLIVDFLIADGDAKNLPAKVDEAIARKPDVLIGWESVAQVMRAKTTTIPIILTGALDPVQAGLARSLRQPGLNVTGLTQMNENLPAKHLDIMREIHPRLLRVGQIVDERASGCRESEASARAAAQRIGATHVPYRVSNKVDLQSAFDRMERDPPEILLSCPSAFLYGHRLLQYENALRLRIPIASSVVHDVPPGVLFALASNFLENYRRLAPFVDKILRGANPGDLPIEQPTTFELVVNLDTARALGLAIPPSILLRADRIIDSRERK